MKKITSFLFLFFLSVFLFAEPLRLLSFNMGGRNRTSSQVGEMICEAGTNGQNNAIFYNSEKLELINLAEDTGFSDFGGDTKNPARNFLFDKNTCQVVKFTHKSSENKTPSEFIAVNVHLPYTDKAHRARDVSTLERLYARYKQKYPVIIAGDFNYYRKEISDYVPIVIQIDN
ncbi:MAG: hypothetical protein II821_03535 [Treponema sp.]|nr:hypothetical protein [Treponema sp.]